MEFTQHLKVVRSCENEADLSHNWLTPLVEECNHKKKLKLRWEKKNQKGRQDLALSFEGRESCIIELKSPSVLQLEDHFLQIHRYLFSQNYWRDGKLVPALGILSNGKRAILIDGRKDLITAQRTAVSLDLSNKDDFEELKLVIKNISQGKPGHQVHSAVESDNRDTASDVIVGLTNELLKYYETFQKMGVKDPFDSLLQVFLVAVMRDCGYIPTGIMQKCYENKKWSDLTEELNNVLSSNFKSLPNKQDIIGTIYQETRTLCARLDIVPPDCLGLVYERLLHKISRNKAVTSYYTPHSLALSVLEKLDIDQSSKVIDPSCGSGTFLTATLTYLFGNQTGTPEDQTSKIFSFITNNLKGIDRDKYACQVAKAMVLASAAQHCGLDPAKRSIKLPNLDKTIVHSDFFLYQEDFKASHVVGNAPWGGVDDNKKKEYILPSATRKKAKTDIYQSYFRNVDVSCLFLEKIVEQFPKAKIGLLIKQQALRNDGSKKFLPWAKEVGFSLFDFGDMEFFNNPSSLTAIAYRKTNDTEFIIEAGVIYPKISNNMSEISSKFHFFEAFQASKTKVYLDVAERLKKKGKKFKFIVPMYPTFNESEHFNLPKKMKDICFIPNGKIPPKEFVNELTKEEKKVLSSRVQVSSKFPMNFRGTEGIKYYKFNTNDGIRITMPINFNPIRSFAMLDLNGKGIPIMDFSCVLIPKEGTSLNDVYCLLGWLNSKYFYFECLRSKLKRLSGGRMKFQGAQKLNICIPNELYTESFATFVKGIVGEKITPQVLKNLDDEIIQILENKNFENELSTLMENEELLKAINIAIAKNSTLKKTKEVS